MTAPTSSWTQRKPRLHVTSWGGTGPGILLAHGMAGNVHWWDDVAPLLSPRLSPHALDFHGHGESDWLEDGRYGADVWVSDIEEARAFLSLERFVLCGHSLGARMAMEYARRYPERLSALILVDFLAERAGKGEREFERARSRKQPLYPDPDQLAERFRLQPRGTLLSPERLKALGRLSFHRAGDGYTWNFDWRALHYLYEPVWGVLPHIRTPTLVVRGENSSVLDRAAFARAITLTPGVLSIEIPNAHHHVPLDTPQELAAAILGFLD